MRKLKKLFWLLKAYFANVVYGFPSKKLKLIGVTGTDGKTSTTTVIYHALHELGEKVDYVSTVGANVAGKTSDIGFHVTTPRFFALQKLFRQAVKNKTHYFVLEVTSHAIDQLRVWGCHFKIAVLTNVTEEHLDYHKRFNDYAQTKISLINKADTAVVNTEAPTFYRYKHFIKNKNVWYTGVQKKADIEYQELVKLGLRDDFNCFEKENALLAYGVCRVLGFPPKKIVKALNSFERVKGRFDHFVKKDKEFLIDFAHTPNAFVQLYKALKATYPKKEIIHVFGCAGLRDKSKRAKMGQIAGNYADKIILTEEDYRTESIDRIFAEIEKGIKKIKKHEKDKTYYFVPNRQEAIKLAVELSGKDSLILLTGKAHEKSLARGRREFAWDEYGAVEEVLRLPAAHD